MREHSEDVGGLQYLQEFVAGIAFPAADLRGCVEECQALAAAEVDDGGAVETLSGLRLEVMRVAEMYQALDTPEVVDPVGVKLYADNQGIISAVARKGARISE